MEFDHANWKVYFLLYEPYMASYSVKMVAILDLVQEMIHGYDNEWDISRTNEKKSPLILLATGAMKQQPTIRAFLGRVVEEKFHMQALAMTIIPGISLVPERLREMIHPEVAPIQLGDGAKEEYFYVNLSMNQNFSNGPEFYENTSTGAEFDEDEPYFPPEYPSYVRRMSDSSSAANMEKHYDQPKDDFSEDMLRYAEISGSEKLLCNQRVRQQPPQ
ncbi:hypothetical protein RO3G_01582 [Rhizopus delemar RA 99-880]|uniref:Uncharacterized protein n=1 Tax=Rhizopus delemar (strain RA 99-880 / ATCC MYA-4621 / FGSC 9543 / NRRL 43880) TaxID=246409 RepID=I1BKZ8_RHIO9|nr:hypothetical protein RO3G_01582 [Rhizopus delemar RA 99-880]|eukprot:EIE76878.1 hypothetical protein RO3G_01582 [Rhizopus delemar RA 99-880]